MLNKQGPNKIDYCDYTWNPVSGCLHNCPYCYLRRIGKRYKKDMMTPKFKLGNLADPLNGGSDIIFAGSSGDMFGEWVPESQINMVLQCAKLIQEHAFIFMTKNPYRYGDLHLPQENCWYGASVDGTRRTEAHLRQLVEATNAYCHINRFVSFEPLLAPVDQAELVPFWFHAINWVIIGGDSNPGAKKPRKEWADAIISAARAQDIPVWVKDNYGYPERIKEHPAQLAAIWKNREKAA